jgi:pimeloyl-ACP methyl ester carboxylesterase
LLVHGSVVNGEVTWAAQRPLAERFDLVVPNRRGFPPGPDVERVDFDDEAVWLDRFLEAGTHVVGHSYGGVIALLAAARRPELVRSLTVIEPPAFGLARGHPAVEEFVAGGEELWKRGPRDPETFLRTFMHSVDSPLPPGRLTAALLQGARTLMVERVPWEARVNLDRLAGVPLLAVSGGHSAAFDAVLDALGGERVLLTGAAHSPQRLGEPFNERLASFVMKQNGG